MDEIFRIRGHTWMDDIQKTTSTNIHSECPGTKLSLPALWSTLSNTGDLGPGSFPICTLFPATSRAQGCINSHLHPNAILGKKENESFLNKERNSTDRELQFKLSTQTRLDLAKRDFMNPKQTELPLIGKFKDYFPPPVEMGIQEKR